jgi:hypothetical protein
MNEMAASDLLNDVRVVEHPGGTLIGRGLDDWIIEPQQRRPLAP